MKMKKKVFDGHLYMEGLRQIKTISLVSLIITLIIGIAVPFINYLQTKSYYIDLTKSGMQSDFTPAIINTDSMLIYYALFFLVFTPIMVFSLFRFLGKREESDFYHAIPQTRNCLFFSFSAAIFTSLAVQITVVTGVGMALYSIFSKYLTYEPLEFVCFGLNTLVLCIMVASVLMLAYSISGSMMTSVIVFLMLFFLPRIFIEYYQRVLLESLPYAMTNDSILSIDYHLFFAFFHDTPILTALSVSTVYTLALGILFYAVAVFAFHRRSSETAGNAMNSRRMQALFRTLFVMVISLVPISLIYSYFLDRNLVSFDSNDMGMFYFFVILSYVIVTLAMFLYELLTTKNAKNALKSLKTLPLIAVLNVFVLLLLLGNFQIQKNYRIDSDKVTSVSIVPVQNLTYVTDDTHEFEYFTYALQNMEIKEKDVIDFLSETFNDYADAYNDYLDGKTESFYNYDYESGSGYSMGPYQISFHGIHKTFELYMSDEEINEFYGLLSNNNSWKKAYTELPDLTKNDYIILCSNLPISQTISDEANIKNIYTSLQNELSEVSFSDWMIRLNNASSNSDLYLHVEKKIKGDSYIFELPISEVTPKTYALTHELWMEEHENDTSLFEKVYSQFSEYTAEGEENASGYSEITLYVHQKNSDYTGITLSSYYFKDMDTLNIIRDQIKPLSDTPSENDVLVLLECYSYSYVNLSQEPINQSLGFYLPADTVTELFQTADSYNQDL